MYMCVTDLDHRIEIMVYESLLTTFQEISIFVAAGAVFKIDSSLTPKHCTEV